MSAGAGSQPPSEHARQRFSDELPFVRLARPMYAEELDLVALAVREMTDHLLPALARAAAAITFRSAWKEYGYARAEDFCRERFSRSGRWLRRLSAIGRAMRKLPGLAQALTGEDGSAPLTQEQAYQIVRVAKQTTVAEWIAFARRVPVRELRAEVRRALAEGRWRPAAGDGAGDGVEPDGGAGSDAGAKDITGGDAGAAGAAAGSEVAATDTAGDIAACGDTTAGDAGGASARAGGEAAAVGDAAGEAADAAGDGAAAVDPARDSIVLDPIPCDLDGDEDDDRLVTLRLFVPGPVRAAWEEVYELHRAVSGGPASLTSFVGALVGEAQCAIDFAEAEVEGGRHPEDYDGTPDEDESWRRDPLEEYRLRPRSSGRRRRRRRQPVEPMRDAALDTWLDRRHLAEVLGCGAALLRAAGPSDAVAAVQAMEQLLAVEERAQRILGEVLFLLAIQWGFRQLGFDDLEHYAEERLGMSGSAARERVVIARGLRWRPHWRRAWLAGRISSQKMLILLRGLRDEWLTEELEASWAVLAEGVTCRRLRDEVRLAQRETWMRVWEGPPRSRKPGDDRAWRRSLHRGYGRTRARMQEVLERLLSAPSPATLLALRLPRGLARDFLRTVERMVTPERLRRECFERGFESESGEEPEPAPDLATELARTFSAPWFKDPWSWKLFCMLWLYAEEWDRAPEGRRRAEQAIYERDGWRCQAPACSSQRNLEAHHVVYRSQGGGDAAENLVTLCRFHHQRGEHGWTLRVTGRAPDDVTFEMGRAGIGGTFRNDRYTPSGPRETEGPFCSLR